MPRRTRPPESYPTFQSMPVRYVELGHAQRLAVHVSGTFSSGRHPVICLAGYHRNMSDFADFLPLVRGLLGEDWPIAAIDLRGRGRSSDRTDPEDYTTTADADDLNTAVSALGLEEAVFVGQGHGGQVIMALAAQRPVAVGAAILIDAGPLADSRGLVRMRNNLRHLSASRGATQAQNAFEHILSADYPSLEPPALARLAARTHFINTRGRLTPLFDPALEQRLDGYSVDDVFEPQWRLFNALSCAPLMLMRCQFSDQIRRETFEEMIQRRADAISIGISGQGSPALLNGPDEVGAIADFIKFAGNRRRYAGNTRDATAP